MWAKFHRSIKQKLTSAVYRIQPTLLAQDNVDAWSNLGCWQETQHYPQAAQQLALQLASATYMSKQDRLLEIGCGYGASLKLWHKYFAVEHISVVELQKICCEAVAQKNLAYVQHIFAQSIFETRPPQDCKVQQQYDVILSVDATYHYALQDYLVAIQAWLAPQARVGFHVLLKSSAWDEQSPLTQRLIKKLKYAKVNAQILLNEQQLFELMSEKGYQKIECHDLSVDVLQGFADYILNVRFKQWSWRERATVGALKIYMTAKLCRYLMQSQQVRYVQVTAQQLN